MKVSKEILDDFKNGKTSLGDNPAFPSVESMCVSFDNFDGVLKDLERRGTIDETDDISSLMEKCMEEERKSRSALEQLCRKIMTKIFEIPEDVVDLKCTLVEDVDVSMIRDLPDKIADFEFEDTDEMDSLAMEIYRRRLLMALISGASVYCANNVSKYISDLDRINPLLRPLYGKIMFRNLASLYCSRNEENKVSGRVAGKSCVFISDTGNKAEIRSEGLIFPILVGETIKGLLELAASAGLPDDAERAEYIVRKSEFKNAEAWDIRIGYPLWIKTINLIDECGYDIEEVGMNFFMMELSKLDVNAFNKLMKNIIVGTKLGRQMIRKICGEIINRKERDDFDNFMEIQNDRFQLDDTFEVDGDLVENK